MAVAAAATVAERASVVERVQSLRDRLAHTITSAISGVHETGVVSDGNGVDRSNKVAGNCHLCFDDIESEALLFLLERAGILASAASSCSSGAQDPSHVLAAMGIDRMVAQGSLRLSLGHSSTDADIEAALAVIPPAVERLAAHGGG